MRPLISLNPNNQIVWCDILVTNLDRAIRFYTDVVEKFTEQGMTFGLLPHAHDGVSAAAW